MSLGKRPIKQCFIFLNALFPLLHQKLFMSLQVLFAADSNVSSDHAAFYTKRYQARQRNKTCTQTCGLPLFLFLQYGCKPNSRPFAACQRDVILPHSPGVAQMRVGIGHKALPLVAKRQPHNAGISLPGTSGNF